MLVWFSGLSEQDNFLCELKIHLYTVQKALLKQWIIIQSALSESSIQWTSMSTNELCLRNDVHVGRDQTTEPRHLMCFTGFIQNKLSKFYTLICMHASVKT